MSLSIHLAQLTIMPHNLLIIDYGLGHPRSVHDAYAFQGTLLARNPLLKRHEALACHGLRTCTTSICHGCIPC